VRSNNVGLSGNHDVPLTILWETLLPKISLISKQVIPYQTCCDIYSSRGYTPKNWFLADSSKANHKPWRLQPSPPYTLLKPQHWTTMGQLTSRRMEDLNSPRKPQSQLNISKHGRLDQWLLTVGLSITTQTQTNILRYQVIMWKDDNR
jgi:hypothetical protein